MRCAKAIDHFPCARGGCREYDVPASYAGHARISCATALDTISLVGHAGRHVEAPTLSGRGAYNCAAGVGLCAKGADDGSLAILDDLGLAMVVDEGTDGVAGGIGAFVDGGHRFVAGDPGRPRAVGEGKWMGARGTIVHP